VAAVIRRTKEGFVRRYDDGSTLRPFHVELRPQPTDRERLELIEAERELLTLSIIAEFAEISDLGKTRILMSLRVIRRALDSKRPRLGMDAPGEDH
jgi:hypothetical protein